jgi:L-ascorbate metabolism protein UlaG (beta-lactamase superfamily)
MRLQLLRHATLVLHYAGKTILVDPMLCAAGALDPVPNAADTRRFPLVELPLDEVTLQAFLPQLNAVLVTHIHRDHWDARAAELLPKDLPLLHQAGNEDRFKQDGFTALHSFEPELTWEGIHITRIGGQHGTGEIGKRMGKVSGVVLRAEGEPVLYIAGDTIWCEEVETALATHQPNITVLNCGAAQFLEGDPITMSADDVAQVCHAAPQTRIVAVHMDTVNHCYLTRAGLSQALLSIGLNERVQIPADGEELTF